MKTFFGLDKSDWADFGKKFVGAVAGLGSFVATGLFLPAGFLFPVGAAVGAIFGYNANPKADAKQKRLNILAFGAVGLAAGIAFFIAKVF